MSLVGLTMCTAILAALVAIGRRGSVRAVGRRRFAFPVAVAGLVGLLPIVIAAGASAAIVPSVVLGTSGTYAVLAGSTVTNTGASTLDGSLGVWPGHVDHAASRRGS